MNEKITYLSQRMIYPFAYMVIVIIMLISLSINAQAADIVVSGECGENVSFVLDSEGTLTISGEGAMENYQIYSFGDFKYSPWMEHKDSVVRIVVEEGITSIGDYAFQYHPNVTDISLPESLTRIGVGAFLFCENLTSISIPPKVEFIGRLAFDGDTKLKDVHIKDLDAWFDIEFQPRLTAFGSPTEDFCQANPLWVADNLYLNGEPVTEVVIPEGTTTIAPYLLSISTLKKVVIPESVTKIEEGAFEGSGLTEISIPESVTHIGKRAFYFCKELTSVEIPNSVTSIGDWAFADCKNLTSVEIPDSVTHIGTLAFGYCDALTEIVIPAGVTKLEQNVFYSCDNISSVTVSNTLASIDKNAFGSCYLLKDVYYYGTEEQWDTLKSNTDSSNTYFLDATVHIKDEPFIVLSDIPSMNIEIGDTITLSAGVRVDQNTFGNASGVTFQLANGSTLDIVDSGTEDGLFWVRFKGVYAGTTYITFHDSISGQKVAVTVTVSENNYFTYNIADVPEQYIEDFPTNFYNVNGLYIDNYQCEVRSYEDPVTGAKKYYDARVSFDVYNTNYTYAIVEVYGFNGELTNAVLIDKRKDYTDSIYGVLGEGTAATVRGVITGDLLNYRGEHNSTLTSVEIDIPSDGYIKITSDPLESDILAIVNCVDMFLSIKSLAGELKGMDFTSFADTDFAETFTKKLVADAALSNLKKDGAKVFEKLFVDMGKGLVITPKTVGDFADTLYKQLTELNLMDVVKDSLLASGISLGENIFIEIFGKAGKAMEMVFMMGKVSHVALAYNDLAMSLHGGAIRISNQGGGNRSAMGVTVRATDTYDKFDTGVALQTYKVELDEELLNLVKNADEESYELLTKGISRTYEISLMQNGKKIQHAGDVEVHIPIPEDIRSLPIGGNVKVYRIEENGTLTDMDAVVEDDAIMFTTEHFSLYTVVGYGADETEGTTADSSTDKPATSDTKKVGNDSDPVDTDTAGNSENKSSAAKIILIVVLVIAACGMVTVFMKKRNISK